MTDLPEIHPDAEPRLARANAVALRLLSASNGLGATDVHDVIVEIVESGRGTDVLLAMAGLTNRLLDLLDLLGHIEDGKAAYLERATLAQLDAIAAADEF